MKAGSIWFVARPVGYVYAFVNISTWLAAHVPLEPRRSSLRGFPSASSP